MNPSCAQQPSAASDRVTAIQSAAGNATGTSYTQQPEKNYFIRYEGNGSKRWDGKEITVDGKWLENL